MYYKILQPGDKIKFGDEFFLVSGAEWIKTISPGARVRSGANALTYRRLMSDDISVSEYWSKYPVFDWNCGKWKKNKNHNHPNTNIFK